MLIAHPIPVLTPTCVALLLSFPGFRLQTLQLWVWEKSGITFLTLAISRAEKGGKMLIERAYPRIRNRQKSKSPGQSTNTYLASRGQHHTECTVD